MTRGRDLLFLGPLERLGDAALLLARLVTGAFLIHGVWGNVTSPARMAEFVAFMRASGFIAPQVLAPFSVYTQLLAGILLVLGLFTRWAGLTVAGTFVVAMWMVHWQQSFREGWPALTLVILGLLFATHGAGRYAADAALTRR